MKLYFTERIKAKLDGKHGVEQREVYECFMNREGRFLEDTRERHKTDPPTRWFVAKTQAGRLLKVVFINLDGKILVKTAYEANPKEISIYSRYG